MSSKALKRLICACSLLLAACLALASDVSDFRAAIEGAKSREELQAALKAAPDSIKRDGSLAAYCSYSLDLLEQGTNGWTGVKQELIEELDALEASRTSPNEGKLKDPKQTAHEILSNPIYIDVKERHGRNWLDKAGMRIGERLLEWLNSLKFRGPRINAPALGGGFGSVLTVFFWVVIIATIGIVLYLVLRQFGGVGRRKRRVGGILEDDEPERTADQWLAQAEKLEAEGKFREAVRCLYIACLVRYDDGRVARFRRHETNWEHLYRIEASALNPKDVDFRTATQKFDKVWYGFQVRGVEDVTQFKEVYAKLCSALQIKSAA